MRSGSPGRICLAGLSLIGCFSVQTAGAVHPKTDPSMPLNRIMSQVGAEVETMLPAILQDDTLSTRQADNLVRATRKLAGLFARAEPFVSQRSPTYQFSLTLLRDYLQEIILEAETMARPPLQQRLRVLGDFCVSCHTQDDRFRTLFRDQGGDRSKAFYVRAEFHYATRNYFEASKNYQQYLAHSLVRSKGVPSPAEQEEMLRVIRRIVSIYIQVLDKPGDLLPELRMIEKNRALPTQIRQYVLNARAAVREVIRKRADVPEVLTLVSLSELVEEYLGDVNAGQPIVFSTPQQEVMRIWLRGHLFRYLRTGPGRDEMAYVLYWLALCDRALGFGHDHTLADYYIKQCITRFPQHHIARTCYKDYRDFVSFYFTTPNEPVLPIEISRELQRLEAYLK